ncbi:MAG: leucyl/phenylalanyl-tRNA--protein transferase [Bacteriovoracaceae bacterium]
MKRQIIFPPVEEATEDGLVAVGGDLETDTLVTAYRSGIFPWPVSVELPLAWFSPDPRGILFLDELHVPRSFEKFLKKSPFKVTFNQKMKEVILECARIPRKNQPGTWITPEIVKGYEKLFKEDLAYSVEVWNEDELIGGLYGVVMGEFVSGESMFMKEDNASKVALFTLLVHLKARGIRFLDTQMVTPVVEAFGGKYIERAEFLDLIKELDWDKPKKEIFG